MGHNLYVQNGKASMMYYGEKPWHGLGQEVNRPASAAEALAAAMLDYEVVKQPVYACIGKLTHTVPNRYAVVRRDLLGSKNCPIYGVVGKAYTPLQNRQAFEFFDPIVGDGAAIYHTAGALGQGEHVWILAKLPGYIRIAGDDIAEKYLLLSNSHDGKTSVQVKFTPIRVVCQNTLTLALERGSAVRVRHTKNVVEKLRDTPTTLGIINQGFDTFEEIYRQMAQRQLDSRALSAYLRAVFPEPKTDSKSARQVARRHRYWAEHFFAEGKGNQSAGVRGSLWAAYNGVTEYIDHHKGAKTPERHLYFVWFGAGYETKARAFEIAASMLGGSLPAPSQGLPN